MLLFLFGALGCSKADGDSGQKVDPGDPAPELLMPDLSDIDLPAAFQDAVSLATSVHTGHAWSGNLTALEERHTGCPDLYVGVPEGAEDDIDTEDATGLSWSDSCTTPGGLYYGGYVYWDSQITASGDAETAEGQTLEASRSMQGSGISGAGDSVHFELKGTAQDALYQVQAGDYTRWTYSSTVEGTVTGVSLKDSAAPGGWRTDMYLYATGGDADTLEARGNVYLFDDRIAGRFDSIAADLTFQGPLGAAPDACTLEPSGWIGLRDENAYWYDLVFLPLDADDSEDTSSACDGCGTLYVRGVETWEYGEVCVDFSSMWTEGPVTLPSASDFILTLQQLEDE